MNKYICDHADECSFPGCCAKVPYSESYKNRFHITYKNGYKSILREPSACATKTVYFIPYFEYLMRKTLGEEKK